MIKNIINSVVLILFWIISITLQTEFYNSVLFVSIKDFGLLFVIILDLSKIAIEVSFNYVNVTRKIIFSVFALPLILLSFMSTFSTLLYNSNSTIEKDLKVSLNIEDRSKNNKEKKELILNAIKDNRDELKKVGALLKFYAVQKIDKYYRLNKIEQAEKDKKAILERLDNLQTEYAKISDLTNYTKQVDKNFILLVSELIGVDYKLALYVIFILISFVIEGIIITMSLSFKFNKNDNIIDNDWVSRVELDNNIIVEDSKYNDEYILNKIQEIIIRYKSELIFNNVGREVIIYEYVLTDHLSFDRDRMIDVLQKSDYFIRKYYTDSNKKRVLVIVLKDEILEVKK